MNVNYQQYEQFSKAPWANVCYTLSMDLCYQKIAGITENDHVKILYI